MNTQSGQIHRIKKMADRAMESTGSARMKVAYNVIERSPGRSYWMRIGVGFVNQDGSINVRLDAVPLNGIVQLRDPEVRGASREE